MLDLNMVAEHCLKISKKRVAHNAVEPDYFKAAAMEVVEAKEAGIKYDWVESYYQDMPRTLVKNVNSVKGNDFIKKTTGNYKQNFAEEIADVIICCLCICSAKKIDVEQCLLDKVKKNELRANKIGDKL